MPMNLPLAQTLQWRSEGVTNNNTQEQWVVCPITSGIFDNIDITTRVSNEGDTIGDLQCLAKITTSLGDTLRSINRTGSIPPGTRLLLPFSNIDLNRRGESVSISCKLQPQFKIISFSVESSD
jgi:hypothetical protein